MINWKELFKSESFWMEKMQNELYVHVKNYLEKNNVTQRKFAEQLGVHESYVSQILNGDFDHKYSTLAEFALAVNKTPWIVWLDSEGFADDSAKSIPEYISLMKYAEKLKKEEDASRKKAIAEAYPMVDNIIFSEVNVSGLEKLSYLNKEIALAA